MNIDSNRKIHECILNINIRVINIQDVKLAYKPLNVPSGNPVDADIMFFSIVKLCTVYDELKILKSCCKNNAFLQNVFYCIQPILEYLMQYKQGCFDVRNNMIAHFQRDKLGNFKPFWPILNGLHIPRDNKEWEFLYDCLDVLRVFLISRFPDFKQFSDDKHGQMTGDIKTFADTFQSKAAVDINLLRSELNKRMIEKGFLQHNEDFVRKFQRN